ncbi:MAG: hypothetical protein ACJATC_002724 [Neptuniibacter pectenicola]|jgi:hypothetical protein
MGPVVWLCAHLFLLFLYFTTDVNNDDAHDDRLKDKTIVF